MNQKVIVIASPHSRNDKLFQNLLRKLSHIKCIRILDRSELVSDHLTEIDPEWIFFPHWSWIIPQHIYDNYRCVIFHMTDVPYGRGGSPLQNLIVRGHKETMLSAIKCEAELDGGPVYCKVPLSLEGTADTILRRASMLMEAMIEDIVVNRLIPSPQCGEIVKFARRTQEDGNIEALENIDQVYDYIRMLDAEGYPAAFVETSHFQLDLTQASLVDDFLEAKVRIKKK
jgi:methionyl-tRNA formyltransferase